MCLWCICGDMCASVVAFCGVRFMCVVVYYCLPILTRGRGWGWSRKDTSLVRVKYGDGVGEGGCR